MNCSSNYSLKLYLMKKMPPQVKFALVILVLLVTNVATGAMVYRVKENEYNGLKSRIQTTIDQKLAVQDQLEAYELACPDVIIEE